MSGDWGLGTPVQSYRDLRVWQAGMALAEAVYLLTRDFPSDERFGLVAQSRRAAASIPANIAEGHGRACRAAYANFLRIAHGSLKELETHVILASRIGITNRDAIGPILADADVLGRMLQALLRSLANPQSQIPNPRP